jgi:hypothetical protein
MIAPQQSAIGLAPIDRVMSRSKPVRQRQPQPAPDAYVLIVRDDEGRPRRESFKDASAYRDRLRRLDPEAQPTFSIEEVAQLLDAL